MTKQKLFSVDSIDKADYNFNQCEKREILSKMLDNLIPVNVQELDTNGTCWNFDGEFYDSFLLNINGKPLETSNIDGDFIEPFLHFILRLAYNDTEQLLCPFVYEGVITGLLVTPMKDDNIRVSSFYAGTIFKYNPKDKFDLDISIKKDVFLKQIANLLGKMTNDESTQKSKSRMWANELNYVLGQLNIYFSNPNTYKNKYIPKRHIKVFDIAYKTLKNDWKFEIYLENEIKANLSYWEKEKLEGNIIEYDFFEQEPVNIFGWNQDCTNLNKLSNEEIKESLEPDMYERKQQNWVYDNNTNRWYSPDEIMPKTENEEFKTIPEHFNYKIKIDTLYWKTEDEYIESFILDHNSLYDGWLDCILTLENNNCDITEIKFNYGNYKKIIQGLDKISKGNYSRFDIDNNGCKMHIWQQSYNSKTTEVEQHISVACYEYNLYEDKSKLLYSFIANKEQFIECFKNALNDIQHKIDVVKYAIEIGQKLDIEQKFKLSDKLYTDKFKYIENFKGNYACVCKDTTEGWGIINKNMEWVIKPESAEITGEIHPKYGRKIIGILKKYNYLHNIDGKFFIATKNDNKQFIIDINGEIQIPHVSDKIYYTYLNNDLWFVAVDYNKTYIVNTKGEDILTLDFPIGEKFWLFDDIIIISKDKKFGIVDWKGNLIIDYIFSEIMPDKDNLDFIPVRYMNLWGYINQKGEILSMKIKDQSEADSKCYQEKS